MLEGCEAEDIERWLHTVRPFKRQKRQADRLVDREPQGRDRVGGSEKVKILPTPPGSNRGSFRNYRTESRMATPPSKRSFDVFDTPRPMPRDDNSVSSNRSSKASKATGTASPTKQIQQAELQDTGFRQGGFEFETLPPSLVRLKARLRTAYLGHGILPLAQKEQFSALSFPDFFFSDESILPVDRCPSISVIDSILLAASECDLEGKEEASWNAEVHSKILDRVKEVNCDGIRVCYETCTSASLIREYRPESMPSTKNDYCITIRPRENEQHQIDKTRAHRPGNSINCMNSGVTRKHPAYAIVETKLPGEHGTKAFLQNAIWQRAQWRNLQWGHDRNLCVEFNASIIVQGHNWEFTASIPDEFATCKVLRPPLQMGDTRTSESICKLLASMQILEEDAVGRFWPTFKRDMLDS